MEEYHTILPSSITIVIYWATCCVVISSVNSTIIGHLVGSAKTCSLAVSISIINASKAVIIIEQRIYAKILGFHWINY